jgi:hypothetical protein
MDCKLERMEGVLCNIIFRKDFILLCSLLFSVVLMSQFFFPYTTSKHIYWYLIITI